LESVWIERLFSLDHGKAKLRPASIKLSRDFTISFPSHSFPGLISALIPAQALGVMANDTQAAKAALFVSSEKVPEDATRIRGPDFNQPIGLDGLLESYASIGFQASGLNKAIEIINRMVCIYNLFPLSIFS
jgi:hypothetical protein